MFVSCPRQNRRLKVYIVSRTLACSLHDSLYNYLYTYLGCFNIHVKKHKNALVSVEVVGKSENLKFELTCYLGL